VVRYFVAGIFVLTLGACRTNQELQAERDAEFQTLVGGTMADFIRRNSLTPSDMYPTSSGRTFVVYGRSTTIVLPGSGFVPTVAANRQCKMLVETVATDAQGTADTWRVTGISRSGPC
jgi:hypothetical protein